MTAVKLRSFEQAFGVSHASFYLVAAAGAAATFFLELRRFSAGGTRSLFFKIRQNDGEDELFLAMVVELNHNIFFVTGEDAAQTELGVVDLRALGEGGFASHKETKTFFRSLSSITYCTSRAGLVLPNWLFWSTPSLSGVDARRGPEVRPNYCTLGGNLPPEPVSTVLTGFTEAVHWMSGTLVAHNAIGFQFETGFDTAKAPATAPNAQEERELIAQLIDGQEAAYETLLARFEHPFSI